MAGSSPWPLLMGALVGCLGVSVVALKWRGSSASKTGPDKVQKRSRRAKENEGMALTGITAGACRTQIVFFFFFVAMVGLCGVTYAASNARYTRWRGAMPGLLSVNSIVPELCAADAAWQARRLVETGLVGAGALRLGRVASLNPTATHVRVAAAALLVGRAAASRGDSAGEVPLLSPAVAERDSGKGATLGRCTVVVHCYTGLADRIFDVIAGVVAAQLARGCVVPTVHVADRDASRTYDWDRVLSSPEFLVRKQRDPMPLKGGPTAQALHIDGRHFCGQHGVGWVSDVLQESGRVASDSEQRARFVHVARSVGLTPCFPPADIADRVGVHARRGDKIKLGWTSE